MKYVDINAIVNVIGNIYNNPSLLDNEKYHFYEEDFTEEFHRILFGSIYNLYQLGAKQINIGTIEDYLEQKPKKLAVYKINKGADYLKELSDKISFATFDYYYQRMKKMTLLRMYNNVGVDLSEIYDIDNILDARKRQKQEEWLDNTPIEEIANTVDKKILDIRLKYVDDGNNDFIDAGKDILQVAEKYKESPEIGYPLFGPLINTVTRGARLKKFYLRSAATGIGKTRAMIADACWIACDYVFNIDQNEWEYTGPPESVIFITTEQEEDEVQTMMLAFVANVNEEHILNGEYFESEWDRIVKASEIISKASLYIKKLPDFSLKDIENTVKYGIREKKAKYVFLDYLHSSMKILGEVTSKTGIKGLREDNVLFMISIRLKDLCNQYGVFIMTATQLNSSYTTAQEYDQNLLRGAKSIADSTLSQSSLIEILKIINS